jgi:hypothetical protein
MMPKFLLPKPLLTGMHNRFAACPGAPFHRLHQYGRERGIVAGPESTDHGLQCFGVGVERPQSGLRSYQASRGVAGLGFAASAFTRSVTADATAPDPADAIAAENRTSSAIRLSFLPGAQAIKTETTGTERVKSKWAAGTRDGRDQTQPQAHARGGWLIQIGAYRSREISATDLESWLCA